MAPTEQLEAIADFWAGQYQGEASAEDLATFKSHLVEAAAAELETLPWNDEDPREGAYLRRFVCSSGYSAQGALLTAAKAAGLSISQWPWNLIISINPGSAYVGVDSKEGIIWRQHGEDRDRS